MCLCIISCCIHHARLSVCFCHRFWCCFIVLFSVIFFVCLAFSLSVYSFPFINIPLTPPSFLSSSSSFSPPFHFVLLSPLLHHLLSLSLLYPPFTQPSLPFFPFLPLLLYPSLSPSPPLSPFSLSPFSLSLHFPLS